MNDSASCGPHPCPVSAALIEAARTLESRLEAALAPLQLSLAKFGVLRCLVHEQRPLPLSAIAQRQKCVRSNMTQLTDRLEADGLVRRVDDPLRPAGGAGRSRPPQGGWRSRKPRTSCAPRKSGSCGACPARSAG